MPNGRELAIRAEILHDQPTPDAYLELAEAIRNDKDNPDPGAALAICLAGVKRYPKDVGLLTAAPPPPSVTSTPTTYSPATPNV